MASHITLECSEMNEAQDGWVEATVCIQRGDEESDLELRYQDLILKPAEMAALYQHLKLYYDQGIWSMGTVPE
jgi:hypothetical protein